MPRRFFKLKMGFWGLAICPTLIVCAFSTAAFLGGLWWRFDLAANFRVQYFLCLIPALIVFLVARKWPWAIVSGVFAIVNFLDIVPAFIAPGRRSKPSSKSATVLLANVRSSNVEYEKVRQLIRSTDPDIIVIAEATQGWMKGLSPFAEEYRYVVSCPREDNFGIALFSRIPFQDSEIIQIGDAGVPTAMARMQLDETELTVVATHPLPPTRARTWRHRNRQLEELAEYVRSVRGPFFIAGDLNTTPWSPYFKRLLRRAGLRDSRRGRGIQPTWQAGFPWFLRIPLDHFLHSSQITVLRRHLGPNIGSDHLPVIVEFSLPRQ